MNYFHDYAARLAASGYLPVPIRSDSKAPAPKDWVNFRLAPGHVEQYNHHGVGILLGQNGAPVHAVDIDSTNADLVAATIAWCDKHLGVAIERVGRAPKTALLFRLAQPGAMKLTGAWFDDLAGEKHRCEILGMGQQVVVLATHPETHAPYRWRDPLGGILSVAAAELPLITLEQLHAAVAAFARLALEHGLALSQGAQVVQLARADEPADPLMRDDEPVGVTLEQAVETLNRLSPDDRGTWISAGMALHHEFAGSDEACAAWDEWSALSEKYPGPEDVTRRWAGFGERGGRRPLTFRWVMKQAGPSPTAAKAAAVAQAAAPIEMSVWASGLQLNGTGQMFANLHNAHHILEKHPDFTGKVRYNTFSRKITIIGSLPWRKIIQAGFNGVPWGDSDSAAYRKYLEALIGKPIVDRDIKDALLVAADTLAYDPLVDMMTRLEPLWDGVERLDTALIRHLGAEDTAYVRAVTRKTFVSAVARVFEPGCKADYVLVLQGAEGMRKSLFASIVAMHPELFGENPPPISGDKAIQEYLAGKLIVELSELASLHGREMEHVKAFISARVDRYRASYGRFSMDNPRRCIFIGTTNNNKPLRDPTGNRRWWVVRITKQADDVALSAEVEQLWAEAVAYYRADEKRWLDDTAIEATAKEIQEEARDIAGDTEALAGRIAEWLDKPIAADHYAREDAELGAIGGVATVKRDRACAVEIWCECLNARVDSFTQANARRIGEAMALLEGDWRRTSGTRFGRYGTQRGWTRRVLG